MRAVTDEFLYKAALQLGRHLTIETLLGESRELLSRHGPVDKVVFGLVSPASRVFDLRAIANGEGEQRIDRRMGVDSAIVKTVQSIGPPTQILHRASSAPLARPLIEHQFLQGDASLVIMRLILHEETVGLLFFSATPGEEFAREHGSLFAGLRPCLSLGLGNCLRHEALRRRAEQFMRDIAFLGRSRYGEHGEIVGSDMGLRLIMAEIRKAAASDLPVVLSGEPGSGCRLLAETIHQLSRRQHRPFFEFDCFRIPQSQIGIYLFGTGSTPAGAGNRHRAGLLERMSGGTVCLRGAERLSAEQRHAVLQPAQRKTTIGDGSERARTCDVRLILLTGAGDDVAGALGEETEFLAIRVPPLRDRKEDIPRLAAYFVEQACRKLHRSSIPVIDSECLEQCRSYHWPGNVWELRTVIEHGVMQAGDDEVVRCDLLAGREDRIAVQTAGGDSTLDTLVRNHIITVMRRTGGKVGGPDGAASLLGLNPSTLRKRMRKLNIPFGRRADYS